MTSLQDLSHQELRAHAVRTIRRGGGSRPDVLLVRANGEEAVLKDYSRADPWFRYLAGPLLARREACALRQLAGARGVPRLLRVVDRQALLLEHITGTSMREVPPGGLTPQFFKRFYRLVERLHKHGVAHCDLRSRGNVLVGADGEPHVVDFTAHFRRGRWWNPAARWLYRKFCEADRVAVARLKRSHAPELLTESERSALARDRKTPLERAARFLGASVRNVSRLLLTRRGKSARN